MGLAGLTTEKAPFTPVWSSGSPFDWAGFLNHLLSSIRRGQDLPRERETP